MRFLLLLFSMLTFLSSLSAQAPRRYTSGELYRAIEKLNFLGSALYIAAHPDDENTRLISYLANEVKAETAYLSLTRGDGGQNLVGPEIRELLGVIRTQELLAARRIDGGQQFFSRANDFSYSKHPDETFAIWNKKEVLGDVVWAIRQWQPDIIINRFDHRTPGRTHGHHTGSAILSVEAFDLAGDMFAYPEQLKYVNTWEPRREFFNTSWWFYGSQEKFEKADKSRMAAVDVGVYYPQLGKSNTEIAAASRTMHKSQGFGSTGTRGGQMEYLELIKGDMPADKENIFEGINTTWSRVTGGEPVGKLMEQILKEFDHTNPAASIPRLMRAYRLISLLPENRWTRTKKAETQEIIRGCLGLYLEAVADDFAITPGSQLELELEAVNRSDTKVTLSRVSFNRGRADTSFSQVLLPNERWQVIRSMTLPKNTPYSNAYWLQEEGTLGMYAVPNQSQRGKPESPAPLRVSFEVQVEDISFTFTQPVVFKQNDPVDGEVYRPLVVIPAASVAIADPVYVFGTRSAKKVDVTVTAGKDNCQGKVELIVPEGWKVKPLSQDVALESKSQEQTVSFTLTPPAQSQQATISAHITLDDGRTFDKKVSTVSYDHIPTQTVLRPATAKVVRADVSTKGKHIGYIMGAGDDVPASLEQIGYEVSLLDIDKITPQQLDKFDAIMAGVRAYNTIDRIGLYHKQLLDYVERGGTYVVQYNTHRRLKVPMDEIGPYPLKISRDRITVEEAPINILAPDHPALTTPNRISENDFDDWVQERGLYFPNEWDEHYTPLLAGNDPGEPSREGGMLVTPYGKGWYVYTGYSFFRELPAGVPGAYRLLANLLSLGKE